MLSFFALACLDLSKEVTVRETLLEKKLLLLTLAALFPIIGCQISSGVPSLDGHTVMMHATTGLPFLDDLLFFGYPPYEAIYLASPACHGPVANRETRIPGGTGEFWSFGNIYIVDPVVGTSFFLHGAPSFDEGKVAFRGRGGFGNPRQEGIYLLEGASVRIIADLNTPIPCSTPPCGNFAGFSPGKLYCFPSDPSCPPYPSPSLDGDSIAFYGGGAEGDGIYLHDGNSIRVVVNRTTPGPGGITLDVDKDGIFSLDGGNVAFVAWTLSTNNKGIYLNDGNTIRLVADRNTPIPGGTGNFVEFRGVSADGVDVAFATEAGVYLYDGASINVVADENTPIPGGTGNFSGFLSTVSAEEGKVAFVAGSGVYLYDGTSLNVVADRNTPLPGGIGKFSGFGAVSADGGNVAFVSGSGVYLYDGNELSVILPPGAFFSFRPCPGPGRATAPLVQ
jgi:hypothetical protein